MIVSEILKFLALRPSEVCHAGEGRHPGSLLLGIQDRLDSGMRRNDWNRRRLSADRGNDCQQIRTLGLEQRRRSFGPLWL
jgi:hypothetical protein